MRRVYCVGRNYAEHAIEMGRDPNKEPPFFFQKNPDNLVAGRGEFPYPAGDQGRASRDRAGGGLSKGGENIPVEQALDHVFGYAVGLDMTRRDLQGEAKKMGRPVGGRQGVRGLRAGRRDRPGDARSAIRTPGAIWLKVNGKTVQEGDLNQLIWKVPEAISYLSGLFRLAPGDVIMTGTPAGVGPVQRGDELHGHIDGVGDLRVRVV